MPFLATPSDIVPAWGLPAGPEWLIIMVVALLLFGKRLPEIMRGLGSSVREFKKGMEDEPRPTTHEPVRPVDGAISRAETQPLPPPAAQPPASAPQQQQPIDNQRLNNL